MDKQKNSSYILQWEELDLSLKEKIAHLPTKPGVYQYKDTTGKIIYVGKAIVLRNRVRSYFQKRGPSDAKTKVLVKKIADVEVIVTDSEAEALILEDTLIKKYKPKYNILLRDDKSYPYVRVTNEPYPRIFVTRNLVRDGSKYYGPFTEVGQLKRIMRTIRSIFLLRSCDHYIDGEAIANKKYKICLDYHIHKCEAPCEGLISKEEYRENVRQAIQILNGKTREIEKQLNEKMMEYSEALEFEKAARIRNRFMTLKEYLSHQKIVTTDLIDRDIFGIARIDDSACSIVFKIRDGKLTGRRHFVVKNALDMPDEELLRTTIEKWYMETEFVPREIFLPSIPDGLEFLQDLLREKRGRALEIVVPKVGDKRKLVNMAITNAEYLLRDYFIALAKREQSVPRTLEAIKRDLRLNDIPRRIECFDNSHIQGAELVSSCVVFVDGKPSKADYRHFKIKTVDKNDDFAAMRETIERRYRRLRDEEGKANSTPMPDLVIIDGGKGQLSSAYGIIQSLGLGGRFTVVGLAKRLDEIFFPGQSDSLLLPRTSSSLKLIQQLRDEAHRFAITFHRSLRSKRTFSTELTNIPGIGEKTAQKLLVEFGSVRNIKTAGYEELVKVVPKKTAMKIVEYFRDTPNGDSFAETDQED